MDISQIVVGWAKKHKEIVAVILGGSRAKGTAVLGSDWDFGIQLEQDPTPALVENLTRDFPLKARTEAKVFPELERHFILAGKGFSTSDDLEVTLGFVNTAFLLHAFKENLHYPVIEQQLEFLKSAKVLYDPKGYVADLREKEFPGWATKKLIADAITLALWNIDKYKKAKARSPITQQLLKSDATWFCLKAVAAFNKIPLAYKYGYDDFKATALNQGDKFLAPEKFFELLESSAGTPGIDIVETLVNQVQQLTQTL